METGARGRSLLGQRRARLAGQASLIMSDQLSEKIFTYVEREAGRDVLLSPEDEAMVRRLLATDPAAQALADDFRDVDAGLKAMFQAFGNMSVPEELVMLIQT